jgi:thiol-disulfide isomerase/thioredoxin
MRRLIVLLVLALAACSPSDNSASTPASMPAEAAAAQSAPAAAPLAWQTLPLVNARTGETFTFADFAGQTVFVEPMATWCSNCRQMLGNVRSAREQLGETVTFVALSVETTIPSADLAAYADANGFDWLFAVMTPDMLAELVSAFGRTISNPPSTPHFVMRPDGSVSSLFTGVVSAEEIVAQIESAGAGGA